MQNAKAKSDLSPSRVRLSELIEQIHFGRIEDLVVRSGDPVFDPPARVVREIRFAGKSGSRRGPRSDSDLLKDREVNFFGQLDQLRDGTIKSLDIQDGLPFRMILEDIAA